MIGNRSGALAAVQAGPGPFTREDTFATSAFPVKIS